MAAQAIAASLYWTALGDALGLPYEGLNPTRAQKLLGPPTRYRLLAGKGMVSDDTEHALLTAEAVARTGGNPAAFERELAGLLRGWFFSLPAGIGWATLRAGAKLALGVPVGRCLRSRSGSVRRCRRASAAAHAWALGRSAGRVMPCLLPW